MTVEIGQNAPDFSALICNGEKFEPFKLSDHIGDENVVLAFFPFAFSPVCTNYFCAFRDNMADFGYLNAKVFLISIYSPFSFYSFIKDQSFNFSLLSDFNKDVSNQYGVLIEDLKGLKGVSKRSLFVIDRAGVVKYRWVSDDPSVMPDFEDLKSSLQSLQG